MASLLNMSGGGLLKKGLPYDAEIEYLESSGTQYIDTGLTLVDGTLKVSLVFDAIFTKISYGGSLMVACSQPNAGIQVYTNSSKIFNQSTGISIAADTLYSIITDTTHSVRNIRVDDRTASLGFKRSITDSSTLYIIGIPDFSLSGRCSYAKYGYFKILFNDVLVRDYIPVRIGTTGYLYDRVSKQLFGNAGTGDFILGSDKTN